MSGCFIEHKSNNLLASNNDKTSSKVLSVKIKLVIYMILVNKKSKSHLQTHQNHLFNHHATKEKNPYLENIKR